MLQVHRFPLALNRCELGQFLRLPGNLLALGKTRGGIGLVIGTRLDQPLPFTITLTDLDNQIIQSRMSIQQATLRITSQ